MSKRVLGEIQGFLGETGRTGITDRCLTIKEDKNSDCSCGVQESQRSELWPISGGETDLVCAKEKRPRDP